MMVFQTNSKDYEIVREGVEEILRINYEKVSYTPSIENNALVMMDVIDKLIENPSTSRITFVQRRHYNYDYQQTQILLEIANLYSYLVKNKKILSLYSMGTPNENGSVLAQRRSLVQELVFDLLRKDPVGAYVEVKRQIRTEHARLKQMTSPAQIESQNIFLNVLNHIFEMIDKLQLIQFVKADLAGYELGDRSVYRSIFRPAIMPDFMFTKIMSSPPLDGEQKDIYRVGKGSDVTIFETTEDIKYLYHLMPPEFKLTEDKYALVDLAKSVLAEHQPKEEEFLDPEKMRTTFANIGKDLIRELAQNKGIELSLKEIKDLTEILIRHTIGFGMIELLLEDDKVQDITINAPIGQSPIFILHQEHGECYTNIWPVPSDSESWAAKLRLLSGRPLDEANPILDTELTLPLSRSRVSVINKPLNPYGLAFAFRRHRDTPWTLPLFIKNRMINPLAAGLISFLIQGSRTMLVAGTRSSGKTSLLGSCLVEILRKYRIITIEDSVTGNSEVLIKKNNKIERIKIGDLIDNLISKNGEWYNLTGHQITGNVDNIEIASMTKKGKINFSRVTKFIRHKVKKPIYLVKTTTGREIEVTGDHSLFSLDHEGKISEIKTNELNIGNYIATPRKIDIFALNKLQINVLDYPDKITNLYFTGGNLKEFLQQHKHEIKQLGKDYGYKKCQICIWFRKNIIPGKVLSDLNALGHSLSSLTDLSFKFNHNSFYLPTQIKLDKDFLTFIGLWIADGCYDKNSVIMSVSSDEEQDLVKKIAKRFNFITKKHSDQFSLMINSGSFKFLMREILELKGNAYTKRMPKWIFNLSKRQISFILKGLFTGDGHVSKSEIMMALSSKSLLKDVQTLLLFFGIIHRIGKFRQRDKTYPSSISTVRDFILFKKHIGLLQNFKKQSLINLCNKKSTHDTSDIIPLPLELKKQIKILNKSFNHNDYIIRNNNNIGRTKLASVSALVQHEVELFQNLQTLVLSDIYWDKVKSVEILATKEQFVYDVSVPENESFICNNIVAHNTLELPGQALRKLGYNIQAMKVRSALVKGGAELSASEGIRASLRLGDSSLIMGEVRSKEAIALYEAMRIGALANVVAGTIHGDSPYGVFDRVVNDLGVPRTSFKATDIIIVANPLKSPDGLHKWRRVTQITEVRKTWEKDPLAENGFVDLMRYNAATDELEPTDDLKNGESEILKSIGANVKEWVGNWDAIWDNILLRADTKKALVDYAEKNKIPQLLEAKFVILANDELNRISADVREETGYLDNKRIFFEWENWLKRVIKTDKYK
ncbi:MAG: ATPase, T2SS/T4P/T4SS family [archaeon]